MNKLKVMVVFGTRPETIKMAPVITAMKSQQDKFDVYTVVTGQHREMLEQSLKIFSIVPDMDLAIMTDNQTLYDVTTRTMKGMEKAFDQFHPDVLLVQGDTSTAFVTALAAFYKQIPVAHVEAGLRTYNKYNPFPEEVNRQLISVVADLHFAPTKGAEQNLLSEKVRKQSIFITGNTAIDALFMTVRSDYKFEHPLLNKLVSSDKKIVTLTTHRRESFGEPMENTLRAVLRIVEKYKDVECLFPVHYNPNVRSAVNAIVSGNDRIHLIDPLDYEDFANLMACSHILLTDSGGIQEEAPSLGKPILVLRETTERPEGIDSGTARLVGTDQEKIVSSFCELMDDSSAYDRMARAVNPYGDGKASARIAEIIYNSYGEKQ